MVKKSAKAGGNDIYEGYCADLAHKLSEQITYFNYKLKLVSDNAYGAVQKDGSWNGMIGELKSGVGQEISPYCLRAESKEIRCRLEVDDSCGALHACVVEPSS
jgi:Ligated ion channel L-glutamate- and glycine-binding site